MLTPRFCARFACAAALAVAATACTTTQRSAEDAAMRRAYEVMVPVTGSRIPRKVDPVTGAPNVAYPARTLNGDSARVLLRGMRAPVNARN